MTPALNLEKFVALLQDDRALKQAATSIHRRKKSARGRQIAAGSTKALSATAVDRLKSALGRGKDGFCRQACELLARWRKDKLRRADVLMALLKMLVALVEPTSALILTFVWIFRQNLLDQLCHCAAAA